MSSIWRWLLGIGRSPGEAVLESSTRLELTALPRGGTALALIVAAVAGTALFWWLYRLDP